MLCKSLFTFCDRLTRLYDLSRVVPQGEVHGARLVRHLDRAHLVTVLGDRGPAHVQHDHRQIQVLHACLEVQDGSVVQGHSHGHVVLRKMRFFWFIYNICVCGAAVAEVLPAREAGGTNFYQI
jgi:hypothetical protein